MTEIFAAYAPIYRRIEQGSGSAQLARWAMAWLAAHGLPPADAPRRAIDWGCGDGSAALVLAAAGYDVTGIDRAPAMLEQARQRAAEAGATIRWQRGDLGRAEAMPPAPPGWLATAFSDTLNYLASLEALRAGWQMLARSVVRGGYVFADLSTPYQYSTIWDGRHVIAADTDDILVLYRLRYSAQTRIARRRISWFARAAASELWQRGGELHLQRAHSHAELTAAISAAGLTLVAHGPPPGDGPIEASARLIYIARNDTS